MDERPQKALEFLNYNLTFSNLPNKTPKIDLTHYRLYTMLMVYLKHQAQLVL